MKTKVLLRRGLLALASLALITPMAHAARFYTTGSTTNVSPVTTGALCLAGGGSDDGWSDGWKYMLEKANGGDVVIIRADGSRGGYETWLYNDTSLHGFPKVNSVQTILIKSASDANLAEVETRIKNAELIFFAGGDQSIYINWFKGSKLAAAVDYMMKVKKVPVGGTSAGMAILGGIDYTANYSSPLKKGSNVTSIDVMKDPTGLFVDLNRQLLNPAYLNEVVTESHFSQRNRQGRVVGFMARAVYNNYGDVNSSNVKGIAADEATAYCYSETGTGKVFGLGSVFFLKGNAPIERIVPGASLNWVQNNQAVKVYQVKGVNSATASFDVFTWTGSGGTDQYWWVDGSGATPVFGIN